VNPSEKDISVLFRFTRNDTDIVVVCLQEMVELNSYNVILGSNKSLIETWK
jgi:hypothetical protein